MFLNEDRSTDNRRKGRRVVRDIITIKPGDENELLVFDKLKVVRLNEYILAPLLYNIFFRYKPSEENIKIINDYFRKKINTNSLDISLYEGMNLNDLLNYIKSDYVADDDNKYSKNEYPYNGYKIVKINSFEEAKKYSSYCEWCVTQSKKHYLSYTYNQDCVFYFCLKYNWQNSDKEDTMIAILVDSEGRLSLCTSRRNDSNHYISDKEKVCKFFNITNFDDIFKPLTEAELEQNENDREKLFEEELEKLKKEYSEFGVDESIEDLFNNSFIFYNYDLLNREDEVYSISFKGKKILIDSDLDLLDGKWYDYDIYYEEDLNLYYLEKNGSDNSKYFLSLNLPDDSLIKEVWIEDYIKYREYDLALFLRDDESYILLDAVTFKPVIENKWYNWIFLSKEANLFYVRTKDDLTNYYTKDGKKVFKKDYYSIGYNRYINLFEYSDFEGKRNFMDINGNNLFKNMYDYIDYDKYSELFEVELNGREYVIDINENEVVK